MADLAELVAIAAEKRERVKIMEMMNTPVDPYEQHQALYRLALARQEANQAEAKLREACR
jgi:hypothetical protein